MYVKSNLRNEKWLIDCSDKTRKNMIENGSRYSRMDQVKFVEDSL